MRKRKHNSDEPPSVSSPSEIGLLFSEIKRLKITKAPFRHLLYQNELIIDVRRLDDAERLYKFLVQRGVNRLIRIYCEGMANEYRCILPVLSDHHRISLTSGSDKSMIQSRWILEQTGKIVEMIPDTIIVYRDDAENGYPLLGVRPEITAARLHNQKWEGTTLYDAPEGIREPRVRLFEKLKTTPDGFVMKDHYNYLWGGFEWEFEIKAFHYAGEIVLTVADAPGEGQAFQKEYWRRQVSRGAVQPVTS